MKIRSVFSPSFSAIGRATAASAIVAALVLACDEPKFTSESVVNTVRVLAVQSSEPYANPGDEITLTPLAVDGRLDAAVPMTFYWVPTICSNPSGGSYFSCYSNLSPGFRRGEDVTSQLYVNGDAAANWSMQVTVPENIIDAGTQTSIGLDYGTLYAYFIACAGRVTYTPPDPTGALDSNPLTCVDSNGTPVSPDDFVFGYAQVFSFAPYVLDGGITIPITNTNPVIEALLLDDAGFDTDAGFTLNGYVEPKPKVDAGDIVLIDTIVPQSSWELDQDNVEPSGSIGHEEIWVDYFATSGSFNNDDSILYDPNDGLESDTAVKFTAPDAGMHGTLWAVVHDDRGGVAWTQTSFVAK